MIDVVTTVVTAAVTSVGTTLATTFTQDRVRRFRRPLTIEVDECEYNPPSYQVTVRLKNKTKAGVVVELLALTVTQAIIPMSFRKKTKIYVGPGELSDQMFLFESEDQIGPVRWDVPPTEGRFELLVTPVVGRATSVTGTFPISATA